MKNTDHYLKQELYSLVRENPSIFDFFEQGSLDGIWYWDLENKENEWMSPRFWTLLGYDPAEKKHLTSEWQDLIYPEDLAVALRNFNQHIADPAHPYDQIVRYHHKDGSTVWVRCRGIAIRDVNGKPIRMLGAHTDLTAQKQAEENLRNHEQFLSATLDAIQDGISVLDHQLRIIDVNRTMKMWYDHMLPLVGKKCYQAYHGRSEPCEVCPTLRAMQSGKMEMNEVPLTQADGVTGTLELFAFPMVDDSGTATAVVEYVRDITDRKQKEAILREREQLYRALFEKNRTVMLLINPETGAIEDANPSACAYYGYAKDTLTQMKITDINMLSEAEIYAEMQSAKNEQRNYFNFRHRLANGAICDVEVFSGPITFGGRSLLCSIVHDISERKVAEQERENLIGELKKALSEVKTLQGFLPICSRCKKIRDDQGYWNQIETYLRDHSEARFSHGICPECARKLYPDIKV